MMAPLLGVDSDGRGSWLQSEENFRKVKQMIGEDKILGLPLDLTSKAGGETIGRVLEARGLKCSAAYLSNLIGSTFVTTEAQQRQLVRNFAEEGGIPKADDMIIVSVPDVNTTSVNIQTVKDVRDKYSGFGYFGAPKGEPVIKLPSRRDRATRT